MAGIENKTAPVEIVNETLKSTLNPLLEEYLKERLRSKESSEKKQIFLESFLQFSLEERRNYRDYTLNVIGESPKYIKDFNDDFVQIMELLSSMDKLEVYAGICNNCKQDLTFELPTPPTIAFTDVDKRMDSGNFKNPDFTLNGGTIEYKGTKLNLNSPELPKLNQFNMYGQYELELDTYFPNIKEENKLSAGVTGPTPTKLIIEKNAPGIFTIYDQDGVKETSVTAKNGKINFSIPRIQAKFILSVGE